MAKLIYSENVEDRWLCQRGKADIQGAVYVFHK